MEEAPVSKVLELLRFHWMMSPIHWLDKHIKNQSVQWKKQQPFDDKLIKFAVYYLAIAFLFYCLQGYHTGFEFFQTIGLVLFPEVFWENITFIGDTLVALTIVLLFAYRFPQLVFALLVAAVIGSFLTHGLKGYFDAVRPGGVYPMNDFYWLGSLYKRCSFPSGHTLTAFTLAGLLTRCVDKKVFKLGILWMALLVGSSRVVVGAHWPIDVFVGAAGGLVCAWLGFRISDHYSAALGARWYLGICAILVFAALSLFSYDGGFGSTSYFGKWLALFALMIWCGSWAMNIFKLSFDVNRPIKITSKETIDS